MRPEPIFATEANAARLLDMRPAEFRQLVEAGHLPGPVSIGPVRRYDVEHMRRVILGEVAAEALQW